MYPPTYLEWFYEGSWKRIGWTACSPKSADDLRDHGRRLAAGGGRYRLITPSHLADEPPIVLDNYGSAA